jgi:hypothetical protein
MTVPTRTAISARKGLLICVLTFAVLAFQACIPENSGFILPDVAVVHDHHAILITTARRRDAHAMPGITFDSYGS